MLGLWNTIEVDRLYQNTEPVKEPYCRNTFARTIFMKYFLVGCNVILVREQNLACDMQVTDVKFSSVLWMYGNKPLAGVV
jgi:hypothetical protein